MARWIDAKYRYVAAEIWPPPPQLHSWASRLPSTIVPQSAAGWNRRPGAGDRPNCRWLRAMRRQIGTFSWVSLLLRGRMKPELAASIAALSVAMAKLLSGEETSDYRGCSEESAGSNKWIILMKPHCRCCQHQQFHATTIALIKN